MKKVYHTMFKNSKIELETFTIKSAILRSPLKHKNNVRNKDFFFDSFEQNQQNKQKVFRRWLILDRKRENRLCVFGN